MSGAPTGFNAPKTNWTTTDPINLTDLNRIEGNAAATELGTRTLDQALANPANVGTLRQILSWFAGRIRAITGATNWWDAPVTTLATAHTHHGRTDNPHAVTAGQTGAWHSGNQGLGSGLDADLVRGAPPLPPLLRIARTTNIALTIAENTALIDITSGTFTQTFAAAATLGAQWSCYISNSGTGDITLDPDAAETIDGLVSYIMYPGECRLITCNGAALNSVVISSFARTFSASGTFVLPPHYTSIFVELWGGGGGGGSGCRGLMGMHLAAGGGGGGGAFKFIWLPTTGVDATTTVTAGAGGTGAAGVTVNDSNGASGGTGGTSSFGAHSMAQGGRGGGQGLILAHAVVGQGVGGWGGVSLIGVDPAIPDPFRGGRGGHGDSTPGVSAAYGGAGGGGGGVVGTAGGGGSGAAGGSADASFGGGGAAGVTAGAAGGNGSVGTNQGGGGGAGSPSSAGGNGGNGADGRGGGGGSGGSAVNGFISGAGGRGGHGSVVVRGAV